MSDTDSEPNNSPIKRRGSGNIRQAEKKARTEGVEFVTSKGKLIEEKKTGPDCKCRNFCTDSFSQEEKSNLLKLVYSGKSKNQTDTFLMGLITRFDVERHRPKNDSSKQNVSSFKYCVLNGNTKVEVCRKAFLSLNSISNKALQRLTNLLNAGELPVDKRGFHGHQPRKSDETLVKIKSHIESFPKKVSHYSSRTVTYLDATLSVKKIYEMFIAKYPDLTNEVKYEYFLTAYKQDYGYRFGRPQVDVCSQCEDLNIKMKSSLNNNTKLVAAAEMLVHKRRANKFYKKMQSVPSLCEGKKDVMAISFDFMQNVPLPALPVQEMFYLRKLWLYVFSVHNLTTNEAVFYTYHEGSGKKGPNEVCTMLLDYINTKIPAEVKEIYVFSDACGGQNRNHTLLRLLLALTMTGRFNVIHHYFPVRGHSFLPCDRDFATVKRAIRKFDRVYTPLQYNKIIESAKVKGLKFIVKSMDHSDFIEFKKWWPTVFKKTTKSVDKREDFSISKYKHFEYRADRPGYVVARPFIDCVISATFHLKKPGDINLPTTQAYQEMLPVKAKKLLDVRKIVHYVPEDCLAFYQQILSWDQSIPLEGNVEENNSESDLDE